MIAGPHPLQPFHTRRGSAAVRLALALLDGRVWRLRGRDGEDGCGVISGGGDTGEDIPPGSRSSVPRRFLD